MPKLTKKEVASRIIAAFPDAGFEVESLVEGNTLDGLLLLESDLQGQADKVKPQPSVEHVADPDESEMVDIEMSSADAEEGDLYELAEGFDALEFYNFSLSKGEKKPLPKRVHGLLAERLSKGHIVPAKRG